MARIAFVLSVLIVPCSSAGGATPEEGARAEGEVVLYSSLNNEQIVTLIDAFKKKYPFIKPSFYRGTSERVLQRSNTEAKAGRFAVDVMTAAGFQVQLMKDSGSPSASCHRTPQPMMKGLKIPMVIGSTCTRC